MRLAYANVAHSSRASCSHCMAVRDRCRCVRSTCPHWERGVENIVLTSPLIGGRQHEIGCVDQDSFLGPSPLCLPCEMSWFCVLDRPG